MKKIDIKSVMITSYNRPYILERTLEYLFKSQLIDECNIVIVQQDINNKFTKIFQKINHKNFFLLKTKYPQEWNAHKKMILNGREGLKYCFEKLNSDICFYLEDDIAVSKDFIKFCSYIINKYKDDDNFFGVNCFSKEKFSNHKIHLYSKFIYGIGKGWAVPKKRWKLIKKLWNNQFVNKYDAPLYDAPIEKYIKDNFKYVVMPINSRSYEIPSNGVNISIKNNQKYFFDFKKSFVNQKKINCEYKYTFFQRYAWRSDCVKYKGQLFHYLYSSVYSFFLRIYLIVK
jgi:hypothetical protein